MGTLPALQIDNAVRSPPYEEIFSSILTVVSPVLAFLSDLSVDVAVGGALCLPDLERTWVHRFVRQTRLNRTSLFSSLSEQSGRLLDNQAVQLINIGQ